MSEYFSDPDDATDAIAVVEAGPAYAIDTWNVGRRGPQCSQQSEFCYFCAFRKPDSDDTANDECSSLWEVVDDLVAAGRELPDIINSIYRVYDKHVRPTTKYIDPQTDKEHVCPAWSKESIKRHLLFSNAYPQLFDGVVDQIFHSLIFNQQNNVMDVHNNLVIEDRRQALMDSIAKFARWRKDTADFRKHSKARKNGSKRL